MPGPERLSSTDRTHDTLNAAGMSFNHVGIKPNFSYSLTIQGTLDVNGDLAIGSTTIAINGGPITVAGNLSSSNTTVTGNASIVLDSTGNQYITAGSGRLPGGKFVINKSGGIAELSTDLILTGGLSILNGTFVQGASFGLKTGDTLVVGASGAWNNIGMGYDSLGGNVVNSGTITIDGGGAGCGERLAY